LVAAIDNMKKVLRERLQECAKAAGPLVWDDVRDQPVVLPFSGLLYNVGNAKEFYKEHYKKNSTSKVMNASVPNQFYLIMGRLKKKYCIPRDVVVMIVHIVRSETARYLLDKAWNRSK
jgi:hypothetical protein